MGKSLPEHPRMKQGFVLISLDETTALFKSPDRAVRLSGSAVTHLMPLLVPLLDGTRTIAQLCAVFSVIDRQVIEQVILSLAQHQLLESELPPMLARAPLLSPLFNTITGAWRPQPGQKPVEDCAVLVITDRIEGDSSLGHCFARLMREMGIGNVKMVPASLEQNWDEVVAGLDLVMFLPDKPLLEIRETVHKACLGANVKISTAEFLSGTLLSLGPTVVPGQTACWTCLDRRQQGVQEYHAEYLATQRFLREHPKVDLVPSRLPPLVQMLAGLAAWEALRVLTNIYPPATYGNLLIFHGLNCSIQEHPVLKLPRCPDCNRVHETPLRRIWSW